MADPLSAAALGAAVLTQGIGFLYGQVAELLRRRRKHRDSPAAAGELVAVPPAGEAGQVLNGQLTAGPVDEQALDHHAEQLARLRGLLTPYVEGDIQVDPHNRQLVEQVEAARRLLEQIYRQHITFAGEQRPATGTPLQVQSGDVGKYATQVIARVIASGAHGMAAGVVTGTVITGEGEALDHDISDFGR